MCTTRQLHDALFVCLFYYILISSVASCSLAPDGGAIHGAIVVIMCILYNNLLLILYIDQNCRAPTFREISRDVLEGHTI